MQKRGFENGDGLSLGNSTLTYIISHRFSPPRRSLLILLFSTKPNKRLPDSIEWFLWRWINRESAQRQLLLYCSPIQTQIINSSSRDYIRRGLRTSLGLLLLCCRCQNFKHFGTPHSIHHSATFILSAVPGSFDLSFDASYRAGLIIFHQNLLQNQTPFHSFDGKSKTTKNVIELALPDSFHPSLCSVCLLKQQEVILLLQLNYMIWSKY